MIRLISSQSNCAIHQNNWNSLAYDNNIKRKIFLFQVPPTSTGLDLSVYKCFWRYSISNNRRSISLFSLNIRSQNCLCYCMVIGECLHLITNILLEIYLTGMQLAKQLGSRPACWNGLEDLIGLKKMSNRRHASSLHCISSLFDQQWFGQSQIHILII